MGSGLRSTSELGNDVVDGTLHAIEQMQLRGRWRRWRWASKFDVHTGRGSHPRGLGRRLGVCHAAGWWHSHHNESDSTAWVSRYKMPGLYTHPRTLDIRFADDEIALHREGRIRGTAFNITNKQYLEVVSTHQAQLDAADNDVPNFNYGL